MRPMRRFTVGDGGHGRFRRKPRRGLGTPGAPFEGEGQHERNWKLPRCIPASRAGQAAPSTGQLPYDRRHMLAPRRDDDPVAGLTGAIRLVLHDGATALLGGSGFLAVYVAGLRMGDADFIHKRRLVGFHDAIA